VNTENIEADAAKVLAAAEAAEKAKPILGKIALVVLGIVLLLAVGWCSGQSHERTVETATRADSIKKVLADSAKAIHAREVADATGTLAAVKAEARAHDSAVTAAYADSLARIRRSTARAAVTITSDTTVTVHDSSYAVPQGVTATIHQDDATIAADSLALRAAQLDVQALGVVVDSLRVQLTDATADAANWKQTANVQAAQLAVSQPKHRFGFKSGVATGLGLAIAIVHFVR
jgi:hypothetical protein